MIALREAAVTFVIRALPAMPPLLLILGCIGAGMPPDNGDSNGNGNGNGDPDVAPLVRLVASNVTPQPNEQLSLRCEVTNDAGTEVAFEFQSSGLAVGRLQTAPGSSTASLIIQESDVGVTFTFTCTGANVVGTGPESAPVLVIATAAPGFEPFPP